VKFVSEIRCSATNFPNSGLAFPEFPGIWLLPK